MEYDIDFYKDENLSPDEKNLRRRNQSGVWLSTGLSFDTQTPRKAIDLAHREPHCGNGFRLRAVHRIERGGRWI